jgi:hypothetical protein
MTVLDCACYVSRLIILIHVDDSKFLIVISQIKHQYLYQLAQILHIQSADLSGSGMICPGALAEWSKALDLNSKLQ